MIAKVRNNENFQSSDFTVEGTHNNFEGRNTIMNDNYNSKAEEKLICPS